MVFSETIHAMLLTHDKSRQFTPKKIADAKTSSEVLICISADSRGAVDDVVSKAQAAGGGADPSPKQDLDRKSTRLNSSHQIISYAVFCLKKKKKKKIYHIHRYAMSASSYN